MTQQTDYHKTIANTEVQQQLAADINNMVELAHGVAVQSGWWLPKGEAKAALAMLNDPDLDIAQEVRDLLLQVATKPRNAPEQIALIHSEVSEMMEGVRKDLMDDKLPHRKMEEVEAADILLRVMDYCGGRGLDLGGALAEKLAFNTKRADHKPENREKDGGKQF